MYLWKTFLAIVPAFSFRSPFHDKTASQISGRWLITSSNRLVNELEGTMMVEIETPDKFRAIGYVDRKLFASKTLRRGSFRILEYNDTSLLGELEFLTDEDMTTSVVGIGLPEPISTKSESLGNRKRKIRVYDISLDRIVVRFLKSDTYYVLERRMESVDKDDNVIYEILATQVVTVMTSILFEIFRHNVMEHFQP
jgi:hypothetical protein